MKIKTKLTGVLFLLGLCLSMVLLLTVQWAFHQGLLHYINQQAKQNFQPTVQALSSYYAEHQSWQGLKRQPQRYAQLVNNALNSSSQQQDVNPPPHFLANRSNTFSLEHERPMPHHRPPPPHSFPPKRPHSKPRRSELPELLNQAQQHVIGQRTKHQMRLPIKQNEQLVGWLAIPKPSLPLEHANAKLQSDVPLFLVLLVLMLTLLALFIGLPLARHFANPIKQLAQAVNALTRGDYSQQLNFKRRDELGSLAKDFQTLTMTLKHNEISRSQWIAGISHELRTPLSIAQGEVEAMLEGVRPKNEINLQSVQQEIKHLNQLVNDLYELSNAEIGALRYHKSSVDFYAVVTQALARFADLFSEKSLNVILTGQSPILLQADITRLNQLMNNLLTNEYKYAQSSGTLRVHVEQQANTIYCSIEDSGPGVTDEQLPRLFEYIYRVDDDRNRKTGGSGLGLAISEKIVEAHHGRIHAEHSTLGGLKICIQLPC